MERLQRLDGLAEIVNHLEGGHQVVAARQRWIGDVAHVEVHAVGDSARASIGARHFDRWRVTVEAVDLDTRIRFRDCDGGPAGATTDVRYTRRTLQSSVNVRYRRQPFAGQQV